MDFPYGKLLSEIPRWFVPRQQWSEYLAESDTPATMHPLRVGNAPAGRRWGLGPIIFEEYISDIEPDLAASDASRAPMRVIFWRRIARTDRPHGWHQWSGRPSQVEGFAELAPGEEYWKKWDESARRYRKKWLAEFYNNTHTIERVGFEEFERQYRQSSVALRAGRTQLDAIARLLGNEHSKPHVSLWGIRDIRTQEMLCGLATVDSPTHLSSYYQAGFVLPKAGNDPLMVGLIDHWHTQSLSKGLLYLHLGGFWHPGKPARIMKGYSSFKAKFGLQYITFQPELVRLRWGGLR